MIIWTHRVKIVGIKNAIEWRVGLSLERMVYLGMSWIIFLIRIEVGRCVLFVFFYHYNMNFFVLLNAVLSYFQCSELREL